MTHHYWNKNLKIKKNKYNIYEPINDEYLVSNKLLEKIDIIIVPTLGYDKYNNRIGKGKGYYDRFLENQQKNKKNKKNKLFIGLSFLEKPLQKIITEKTDISLDIIISPLKIYYKPYKYLPHFHSIFTF